MSRPNDDLFSESTMTFGEHIEELRAALVRALVGLMIGVVIGLLVANHVVMWIEKPLRNALENYYLQYDIDELKRTYGAAVPKEMVDFLRDYQLVYEEIYLEKSELARVEATEAPETKPPPVAEKEGAAEPAAETNPDGADPADARQLIVIMEDEPPAPHGGLIKTRIWRRIETRITSLSAHEAFMIWLKAGGISGAIIASPHIFYQLWVFVAAGLYPHERRYVHIYLPFSIVLFLAGVCMAFFFVFDPVLDFLFSFNAAMNIDPDPRISEWIGFVLFLPLGFGIAFQLPLVMLFLNRLGIIGIELYLEKWRLAILIIFVISMLLTPADPISMLLMACPLTVLYFLGIALCRWMPRNRSRFDEGYDPA